MGIGSYFGQISLCDILCSTSVDWIHVFVSCGN